MIDAGVETVGVERDRTFVLRFCPGPIVFVLQQQIR